MSRKPSTASSSLSRQDVQEIGRVAYELWEQRGRTHGGDQLDWFEAERIVRERKAEAPKKAWQSRLRVKA